jgi:C4-dicarboxylate-specific signal transduction histidine kinase
MRKVKFEYRIAFVYLILGFSWIKFSDRLLNSLIEDTEFLTQIQTYKGWFYVLITAILFFLILRKHLNKLRHTEQELEKHRSNLQQMVQDKTRDLDTAIEELKSTNEELFKKNEIINIKNSELHNTLLHLKETQAQLLHADKMSSLGILTAGVAHEINNPLNYILGGLTGLEKYFQAEKDQNPRTGLFLDSIKTGVDKASLIVSGLSQLSSTKETLKEDCEIHEILENCLTLIGSQLKDGAVISKKFTRDNVIVTGNVGQLHQVFVNLLINASHAIEHEGSISILTDRKKESVYIKIADTGCGIDQENLKKITDPFFTTKEPGKGTGLGLSITYNIIQSHKGTISFQSEVNKGTSVEVLLPAKMKEYE